MHKWVIMLKTLPQEGKQLDAFLGENNNFLEFMTADYPKLPDEVRRELERNLATRKGTKFLELLQRATNPQLRGWALELAELLPAELRIPRLLAAFGDKDEEIKLIATRCLGKLKSMEVAKLLVEGLGSGKWLPARIAEALSEIGEPALPQIKNLLTSGDEQLRLYGVEILEQFDTPLAGEVLLTALWDTSPRIRRRVVSALVSFPEVFPGPALTRALRSELDTQTKVQLVRAIGKLKFRFAREELETYLHGEDAKIAQAAKVALESLDK